MDQTFDAAAIIAYLKGETGSDIVESIMLDASVNSYIHFVNLAEVYYKLSARSDEATVDSLIRGLRLMGLQVSRHNDDGFWKDAAQLKQTVRHASLADCFCAALARRGAAEIVTADHPAFETFVALGLCTVRFIR